MTTFPIATSVGLWLMLLWPVLTLGYDAWLKFWLHDPTITADVSSTVRRRVETCLYLGLWTVAVGTHFLLGWLDGYPLADYR
jgi:hypothetical protein